MATEPPVANLPCKDCGYVNEPERVYCHNCGAKLDRSLLPKEDQMRREPPDRARRRIKRMTNPDTSYIKAWVTSAVNAIVTGAAAAVVLVALMPPPDVPPAKAEMTTRFISSDLSALMASAQPHQTSFTQGEINSFLASGKVKKDSMIPGVVFTRSFVNLEPGACRVTIERSLWGYPLYVGTLYRVEATNGVFIAPNTGGNIGRLPIHPLLMQYVSPFTFGDLAQALKTDLAEIRKAFYLHIEKGKVTIATNGAKH